EETLSRAKKFTKESYSRLHQGLGYHTPAEAESESRNNNPAHENTGVVATIKGLMACLPYSLLMSWQALTAA
ncbi:MAG: hypothetical protein E7B29_12605, partial [Mixta calida]|nr:hypothetical protein [Mixta calida]